VWEYRAMPMKDEDYRLSMKISPKGKVDSSALRQLHVLRLSDTWKAILRRPLRQINPSLGVFCEGCSRWRRIEGDFPQEWTCPDCNLLYRMEFAVYQNVSKEEGEQ
jgi:hypothetical protein